MTARSWGFKSPLRHHGLANLGKYVFLMHKGSGRTLSSIAYHQVGTGHQVSANESRYRRDRLRVQRPRSCGAEL